MNDGNERMQYIIQQWHGWRDTCGAKCRSLSEKQNFILYIEGSAQLMDILQDGGSRE